MKKMSSNFCVSLILLSLVGSCGKSSSGGEKQAEDVPEESVDGSTISGLYKANFVTLNPHVNGTIPGSLTLLRTDDKLITYLRLFAGGPRAWHQQGIYLGRKCPNIGDDTNRDGFVDIEEAMKVVGKMIIPLDSNMNSQNAGRAFYPLGDLSGYYHYERVSSFRRLFDDLRSSDLDSDDHVAKLGPNEKFSWEKRVVMVQGVIEETIFPETVAGLAHRKPFQTLPITCGIIQKVKVTPPGPNPDTIPGPVSPVVDGQDRPAPEEEGTAGGTAGGTVAGTTGTNDNEEGEVGDQGGSTGGRSTTTGSTSGGSTTGGTTTGGTTGRSTGGFIGGFIGGSSGGRTGGTSGGETTGSTTGGSTTSGSTTGSSTTTGETTGR